MKFYIYAYIMFHLTRLNRVLKFLPARNSHERVSRTKKNFLIEFSRACLTSKSNPCSFQPARCENIQFDIDDFQLQLLTINFSSFFFILFKLRVNHNKSVWFRHKKKKSFHIPIIFHIADLELNEFLLMFHCLDS